MDFGFSRVQEMLRKSVRDFAKEEILPRAVKLDEEGKFPRDIIKRIADQGLIGMIIPQEYGGAMAGHLARMISIEEISRACASLGLFLQATPLGLWAILRFGTEEQKKKYIPAVVRGEKIMCMAATESTGGSDPLSIQTRAKLEGDEYLVNGRKCFITNGGVADLCVFSAKTGEGVKGLSAFIVEKGTDGFEIGRVEKTVGYRSMVIAELVFTGCKIPKQNLIAAEGDGLRIVMTAISEVGRLGNTAVSLGIAEAAYEATTKFAKERVLYGKPISELEAIQFTLAEMDMKIEASRLLAYNAAWLLDQGRSGREIEKEIARAKIYSSEIAREVAIKAVQVHGAYGTLPEYHVIRYLRDALDGIAAAGTNEIQRVILGRAITK